MNYGGENSGDVSETGFGKPSFGPVEPCSEGGVTSNTAVALRSGFAVRGREW